MNANNVTQGQRRPFFTRLGSRHDLDGAIRIALSFACKVCEDSQALTVVCTAPSGAVMFRALGKDPNMWIISYNRLYWEEPQ